jgi:hypothetical protein
MRCGVNPVAKGNGGTGMTLSNATVACHAKLYNNSGYGIQAGGSMVGASASSFSNNTLGSIVASDGSNVDITGSGGVAVTYPPLNTIGRFNSLITL